MRLKPIFKLNFAALFVAAVLPVYSQVVPSANQGGVPIVIGAGFSDFSIDWGPGKEWRASRHGPTGIPTVCRRS